jgi:hypothetical protein
MTTAQNTQATVAQQAYQLRNKLVYPDSEFDYEAWIVEFPGWNRTISGFFAPQPVDLSNSSGIVSREQRADGFWYVNQFRLPEHIEFETIGDIIHHTDYPECKPNWPIMSKRMLDTLLSVREFPHQTIPITMIDTQMYYDESVGDYVAPKHRIHDFVAVQLLEHLDIFDWERSVYDPDPEMPGEIKTINTLVLRELKDSLPPLFRIKPLETRLYVSPEGRAALEAANIRGVQFLNLVY